MSRAHLADRRALDALLSAPVTADFPDEVTATGVASETAVRHLLKAGKKRLDTHPAGAATIYYAPRRWERFCRRHCQNSQPHSKPKP